MTRELAFYDVAHGVSVVIPMPWHEPAAMLRHWQCLRPRHLADAINAEDSPDWIPSRKPVASTYDVPRANQP